MEEIPKSLQEEAEKLTAECIQELRKTFGAFSDNYKTSIEVVCKQAIIAGATSDYVSQERDAFAEWIVINKWRLTTDKSSDVYMKWHDERPLLSSSREHYSTAELFPKYKEHLEATK